ncbi:hypothetical protein [Halopseudomonas bauzanensis]|uniref:hypothetical protein n=1 Tax=Halopseudomonas bauzanensis TaxID=653930 RepID=UPI0025561F10|nr:hypothetical protein [Halopseudomonas bauzanensis]
MNKNPFYASTYNGRDFYHIAAADRLLSVQRFTLEQCQAALELPDLQKSVIAALERRIRKLEKEAACISS